MRQLIIALTLLSGATVPALAQVSVGVGIGAPNVNLAIHFGAYPQFQPVPGYPVYYAPQVDANYFFYDGMYWVFQNDNWYASSWYNGPWSLVSPMAVPVYILQVPVRYYREPPPYFRGWNIETPPRWNEHYGRQWASQRANWDRVNRTSVPASAPLPSYQQQYFGKSYPTPEQQRSLHHQNYSYQPQEPVVQEHYHRYMNDEGAGKPAQSPGGDRNSAEKREHGNSPGEDRNSEKQERVERQ